LSETEVRLELVVVETPPIGEASETTSAEGAAQEAAQEQCIATGRNAHPTADVGRAFLPDGEPRGLEATSQPPATTAAPPVPRETLPERPPRRPFRTGVAIDVAFRSAKERGFRGAKGDNTTDIDSPVLSKVLAGFMQERNIRWGEVIALLAGAILFVGPSIALVISL
jgi:hypothetical protein